MHFEIIVEDASGKEVLAILMRKILESGHASDEDHTFRVHPYKGIGHLPRKMKDPNNAVNSTLLSQLPSMLRGYGKTFRDKSRQENAVIVVCDLDDKCLKEFRGELLGVLNGCTPRPPVAFCIAIEEIEAWLLGDTLAVKSAYPQAKTNVLDRYRNDSICGTWEMLADAVHKGGAAELRRKGYPEIGRAKAAWARAISPQIEIDRNNSGSFQYFCEKIRRLAGIGPPAR